MPTLFPNSDMVNHRCERHEELIIATKNISLWFIYVYCYF